LLCGFNVLLKGLTQCLVIQVGLVSVSLNEILTSAFHFVIIL